MVAAVSLACNVRDGYRFLHDYVVVDALASWTLVCTALVYCLASIYAVGYMRLLAEERERLPNFYALFALFAATMICGPIMNNIACVNCHRNDGGGFPTTGSSNSGMLMRISIPGSDAHGGPLAAPGFGVQLGGL